MLQKKQGKHRIIKPGIEKHPETDEAGNVSLYLSIGHMFGKILNLKSPDYEKKSFYLQSVLPKNT